ncbi:MAG: FAD-dependent thymidylate synthase [Clostridia bacterium]|nr:FAD-dependent thymidylate synthase [Clostridia bacterium]
MKISVTASSHEGYVAPKSEFDIFSGHQAGICYMKENYQALLDEPTNRTLNRSNNTKNRVHHSVFGHPNVSLLLEDIPKGLAIVLNNEGIYSTSEKSARYTKMVLKEDEERLYSKWFEIYKQLINEELDKKYETNKRPKCFSEDKIKTLAQENARYLTSVFTPATMGYTVSYQQLNYLYQMMKREIASTESNAFMQALKPAMIDFCKGLENTSYIDLAIANGAEIKNRSLSLIGRMTEPEQYFGDVYSVSYQGTWAQYAHINRHRTIDYNITLLDEPKFYVPSIIEQSDDLTREWLKDIESRTTDFPQGMLININEFGKLDWFIQKMKERKCTYAQLETNKQIDLILRKYVDALKEKNHPRAEELEQYTHGSRCTFPDYTCASPCGFKEGINGNRII